MIGPAFLRMSYNSQTKSFSLLLESALSKENDKLEKQMEERIKELAILKPDHSE